MSDTFAALHAQSIETAGFTDVCNALSRVWRLRARGQ